MQNIIEHGNGLKIKFAIKDESVLFSGIDVASFLGFKNPSYAIQKFISDKNKELCKDGNSRGAYYINIYGIKKLIQYADMTNEMWNEIAWLMDDGAKCALEIDAKNKLEEKEGQQTVNEQLSFKTFSNLDFGTIRTTLINNEPWFVGKDVAEALGYERTTKAIQDHVDFEDKDEIPIQDSIGRMQKTPVINESGLYSLIFSSKLESAKKFKRWVTEEVLPQIRKTGGYIHIEEDDGEQEIIAKALLIANKTIERKNEIIKSQKEQIDVMQPKVEFADGVSNSNDCISIKAFANIVANKDGIRIGEYRCFDFLRKERILQSSSMHRNIPYQKYIESGYFVIDERKFERDGENHLYRKTLITGKGQQFLYKLIKEKYVA